MSNTKTVGLRVLFFITLTIIFKFSLAANGIFRINTLGESGKMIVLINDIDIDVAILTVEDKSHSLVFYQECLRNTSKYVKLFDVSGLEDGGYCVSLDMGEVTLLQEIIIENSIVSLITEEEYFEPYISLKDDNIVILLPEKAREYSTVKFLDNYGEFFMDEISENLKGKKYSIATLPAGNYQVVYSNMLGYTQFSFVKE